LGILRNICVKYLYLFESLTSHFILTKRNYARNVLLQNLCPKPPIAAIKEQTTNTPTPRCQQRVVENPPLLPTSKTS